MSQQVRFRKAIVTIVADTLDDDGNPTGEAPIAQGEYFAAHLGTFDLSALAEEAVEATNAEPPSVTVSDKSETRGTAYDDREDD